MAFFSVDNVRMAGLAAAVPTDIRNNSDYDYVNDAERSLLIKTTGIESMRVAETGLTTGDLCYAASEKLIKELNWDKNDIGLLIFISQSRDYFLPATAIILQDKLQLPKSVIAFDVSLGCSGFTYGLSIAASMMKTAGIKKA